jgi:Nuclear transport factor 2 (NTF2) domain
MTARAELLEVVERSPQAAAAHDRAGWVGLFTIDGQIEDPVGSRPHVGHADIGRFYDTFIGPRRITFHRDLDLVADATVVRDLTIEVGMASGLTVDIPAYVRYDLRASRNGWAIAMERAYWELPAMALRMLGRGASSVPASVQLAAALLGNQGIGGTYGFLRGVRGAGKREKRCAAAFLSAATAGERNVATPGLSGGPVITLGDQESIASGDLVELLRGGNWAKPIAAGDTVTASISAPSGRGVLFCEVPNAATGITRIRYFR